MIGADVDDKAHPVRWDEDDYIVDCYLTMTWQMATNDDGVDGMRDH